LSDKWIDNTNLATLAEFLKTNTSLSSLVLHQNQIYNAGATTLAKALVK